MNSSSELIAQQRTRSVKKAEHDLLSLSSSRPYKEYSLFLLSITLVVLAETLSYSYFGIGISYLQGFYVLFNLIRRKFAYAIMAHSLFVMTALEWPADLAIRPVIYTYRTVSIFGFTISTLVLAVLFLFGLLFLSVKPKLSMVNAFGMLLFVIALMNGITGLLFAEYSIKNFVVDFQGWLVFLMSLSLMINAITTYKRFFIDTFERILIYVVASRSIVAFLGAILGFNKGIYGGIVVFTYDAIDLLVPILIIAIIGLRSPFIKIIAFCSWVFGIAGVLLFKASGKEIILFSAVIAFLFCRTVLASKTIVTKATVSVLLVVFVFFMVFLIPSALENNLLFSIKYNEAVSLISTDWISNPYILPPSPRTRVLEFYNTLAFYLENPLFLVTGRGFGGYYEDRYFYDYNASDKGGYTTEEVKSRKFANLHESINVVFLKFGVAGLLLLLYYFGLFLRNTQLKVSVFLRAVGLILLLVALGFSLKLIYVASFCLATTMIGEEKDEENSLY